jgi:methylase of polypeptide subunit release factors
MLIDSVGAGGQGTILEMGVGTGIVIINILKKNTSLEGFGTDIDIHSLYEAEKSATGLVLNLVQCDCASAFREQCFDYTVFNPPYLRGNWYEDATIFDTRDNRSITNLMLYDAVRVTKQNHNIYFVISSETDSSSLLEFCRKVGFLREIDRRRIFFEELISYSLTPKSHYESAPQR